MATDSQLNANRKTAQRPSGPRNAITVGLFTETDYVLPAEQSAYDELSTRCFAEIKPAGVVEESFVISLISARWRLRRCAVIERAYAAAGSLDPLRDPYSRDEQTCIDRARARAFNQLCRATSELRRLQTERALSQLLPNQPELPILASARQIVTLINRHPRSQHPRTQPDNGPSASFCTTALSTPRNAPCPCHSGRKFKRCCGKNAPPVLHPGPTPEPKAA